MSSSLERTIEALLFLSPEPVSAADLAEASEATEAEVDRALDLLSGALADGKRGIVLRNVARGWTLAAEPASDPAARRLLAKPKTPPLTQAQAETLAIVAYLQPISRPEIARIRGVAADSAVAGLLERGLIAEAGRDDGAGGAVRYRTTPLLERVFGLESLAVLPRLDDLGADADQIRERLASVAEQRSA